jgi:hypothetical protein
MRQFIPALLILFTFVAFTGYSRDGTKKNTQISDMVEVAVAAPDGAVIGHLTVTSNYTQEHQVLDTGEGSYNAVDPEGGDPADASLSFCAHSGSCTLTSHTGANPCLTTYKEANAPSRAERSREHTTTFSKSLKVNNLQRAGNLSSRQ